MEPARPSGTNRVSGIEIALVDGSAKGHWFESSAKYLQTSLSLTPLVAG
jgi:hypothetical protein